MLTVSVLTTTPPYDFWRDQIWQSWGTITAFILGIAAIIASIWIFQNQRHYKEITYDLVSEASLANVDKNVEARVQILFDGKYVKDVSVLVIKISNSGNIAVRPEDFIEPIVLKFPRRKLLDAGILALEPRDIIAPQDRKNFLTVGPESIHFPKFLLNPKEAISLQVLVTGFKDEVEKRARIADGRIKDVSVKKRKSLTYAILEWLTR